MMKLKPIGIFSVLAFWALLILCVYYPSFTIIVIGCLFIAMVSVAVYFLTTYE
jgi:hypothetical protein